MNKIIDNKKQQIKDIEKAIEKSEDLKTDVVSLIDLNIETIENIITTSPRSVKSIYNETLKTLKKAKEYLLKKENN